MGHQSESEPDAVFEFRMYSPVAAGHLSSHAPKMPTLNQKDAARALVDPDAHMWTYAYTPAAVAFICTALSLGALVLAFIFAIISLSSSSSSSSSNHSIWSVAVAPIFALVVFSMLARAFHVLRWTETSSSSSSSSSSLYKALIPVYYLVGGSVAGVGAAVGMGAAFWTGAVCAGLVGLAIYVFMRTEKAYTLVAYPVVVCIHAGVALMVQWETVAVMESIGFFVLFGLRIAISHVARTNVHENVNSNLFTPTTGGTKKTPASILASFATWDAVFVAYMFTVVMHSVVVNVNMVQVE